jgi:hypothetical protein
MDSFRPVLIKLHEAVGNAMGDGRQKKANKRVRNMANVSCLDFTPQAREQPKCSKREKRMLAEDGATNVFGQLWPGFDQLCPRSSSDRAPQDLGRRAERLRMGLISRSFLPVGIKRWGKCLSSHMIARILDRARLVH